MNDKDDALNKSLAAEIGYAFQDLTGFAARVDLENRIVAALATARKEACEAVLNDLAATVLDVCKLRGWSLHWTHRGAYLHLESSELIEAVRGKQGDVLGEAADVLLVLMSITQNHGIRFSDVINQVELTIETLKTKPHYTGEEYSVEAAANTGEGAENERHT